MTRHMKKKIPLKQKIYLPEYFKGNVAQSFQKESNQRLLYWDFDNDLDEKIKIQIEILLNEIVRTIKNREDRRNRYLLPLKCLFCRKILFLESAEIDWEANVWFVERLNILPERYSRSNTIDSFSFLDIECAENRKGLQKYLKYLLTATSLNLGTIRIHHTYIRDFLKFLEEFQKNMMDIDSIIIKEYFNRLAMKNIKAQSYNNKLQVISAFLRYLQVTGCISEFSSPIALYYKKNYPTLNGIDKLDQKLDLLTVHLTEFPEQLRIMSLILLFTGIKKGQLFLLRNADFYYKDEHSWMKVPDTTRSIPVPDILHWLVLKYSDRNRIHIENLLFLNDGKKFTAEGFRNAIMKACRKAGILTAEYVFKGNGYQKELCKAFYRNGTSLQTIRDYMGYSTDEIVKKNIGLVDEELAKKSMEYYEKMENNLGGNLLMAKYDKMNEVNRQESRRKIALAVEEIRRMASEGKSLSVAELSQNTGLSRGFFYKNEEVKSVLNEEREKTDQGKMAQIKRGVREKSLEKQVEIYQNELKRLLEENERLKKENLRMAKKLEKMSKK